MNVVTAPCDAARQLSAAAPDAPFVLAVLAKRTYTLRPGAPCVLADEQLPLRTEAVFDASRRNLFVADAETYPFKHLTDVVVRGHAYAHAAGGRTSVRAEVRVGPYTKALHVTGDRRCARGADGQLRFSSPERFERMPLGYDRAYGGWDEVAEKRHGHPWAPLAKYLQPGTDLAAYSPFVYPRNRHGRGYLLEATPEGLDALLLPNLEDPADLLTPERLVVGDPRRWHEMPLPACTTWVPPSYFGRGAFLGMMPFWQPLPAGLAEFERAFLPREVSHLDLAAGDPLVFRYTNGGSLGLQVPYLRAADTLTLRNLHETAAVLNVTLPDDAPRISVDGRNGKLVATAPVIHHVELEPDQGRLSIVWRGHAPALRPYMPDELAAMPFRVEWRMS